jgi:hypothetical protein
MAVSFFSIIIIINHISHFITSHHALHHPADGYSPIASTISHRPGEIKQSNHTNEIIYNISS